MGTAIGCIFLGFVAGVAIAYLSFKTGYELGHSVTQEKADSHDQGVASAMSMMEFTLKNSRNGSLASEDTPLIDQPDPYAPLDILVAYGVDSFSELPPDVREVVEKRYTGGVE